jgi:hypothetical protein
MNSIVVLMLGACRVEPDPLPVVDLGAPLGPTEARAAVVTDEAWLFGGVAAEGRLGDVLIVNDRVRFVIQGVRDGGYYVEQGGGVIDADVVRPEGQPGRDAIDDWMGMFGLGRVLEPTAVVVTNDGALGGPAIVRVEGVGAAMHLVTGALESDALVADLDLVIATDYVLWPGSWILEVYTTVSTTGGDASIEVGDFAMGALEALQPYHPGVGFGPQEGDASTSAYLSYDNDVAYAVVAAPGGTLGAGAASALLGELASTIGGFAPIATISEGAPLTVARGYAVGPDVATLMTAGAAWRGDPVQEVTGAVVADDGAVPGARVHVFADGEPWTVAVTRGDGSFDATAPAGTEVTHVVDARGRGLFRDLDEGAAPWSPYTTTIAQSAATASYVGGAVGAPYAQGRAPAGDDPLHVGVPGGLLVSSGDGMPFEVRVTALDPVAPLDARVAPAAAWGAGLAWSRDGEVRLSLEPGRHQVLVHRGVRFEAFVTEVEILAGQETVISAALTPAYPADGWLLGDPHMHAGPSGDSETRIEDRLLASAAVGLQLHFGTDHDHVVDYGAPLAALGLDGVLGTVVADEVSSVLRGHVNAWPLVSAPSAPSGGALRWWLDVPESTDALFGMMRAWAGDDVVLQLNHPLDSGVGASAGWSSGLISNGAYWTTDFDAVEVMNGGDYDDYLPFYLDLVNRGLVATPVGVSDVHGLTDHTVGGSATFFGLGVDDPGAVTPELLREATRARRVVVTRGPRLDLSIDPGSTVASGASLGVEVRAPSWIVVDRLALWRDGAEVEAVDGASATFVLDPDADASYVVIATGAAPMAPVWPSTTPWAMSAPILVDVDGQGWVPPLPPLVVQ